MKGLLWGILLIIIVGLGGFFYRNALENPTQPVACPLDAKLCPDGTSVARTGNSCTFAPCPPPNVSLDSVGISFAVPDGFDTTKIPGGAIAAYDTPADASTTSSAGIVIRRYAIEASSTALATMQKTAIGNPSGLPAGAAQFSSTVLGDHRFTVVSIERFEGVVDTAYYLARNADVLRFDAIDRNVMNWTDQNLDVSTLPANQALQKMLSTLQSD
ncbi:MAG: hypothetical protein WAN50_00575 [Minisyncoccia bacterium]